MKTLDCGKIESRLNKFIEDRDWKKFHSIKNLSMALNVEASELLEIFQWKTEEDSNQVASDPVTMKKVENELADIMAYALSISSRLNIDLEKVIFNKIDENEKKYPVHKVKGCAKKYDEY